LVCGPSGTTTLPRASSMRLSASNTGVTDITEKFEAPVDARKYQCTGMLWSSQLRQSNCSHSHLVHTIDGADDVNALQNV
jgi:hypothetical protein